MAKIRDVSIEEFRKEVEDKEIYLWGAGRLAGYYIKTMCLGQNIKAIVDKNSNLHGTFKSVEGINYEIISEKKLLDLHRIKKNKIVLFITPTCYAGEIVEYLNQNEEFDEVICYLGVLLRDYYVPVTFDFNVERKERIPRKIHYCWFGKKDIPEHLKRYMDTWIKMCPDYEIICWNENNYDISKNRYMREAYECKKWGFVPDYARLDIIYNEGGIYLDTDVELLTPLDKVLNNEMFCGFQCNYQVNLGSGFGAVKHNDLIKELRDYYDNFSFIQDDGKMNLTTCYEYQHGILEKFGFSLENKYQDIKGHVVYPSEVLAPTIGIKEHITDKTLSIHHLEYSWASEKEKQAWNIFKERVKK